MSLNMDAFPAKPGCQTDSNANKQSIRRMSHDFSLLFKKKKKKKKKKKNKRFKYPDLFLCLDEGEGRKELKEAPCP